MTLRSAISRIPKLRSAIRMIRRSKFDSARYWEQRYARGQNSGSGSYNRLAEFKAEFLNQFVVTNDIKTVIEFGSGDGAQLQLCKFPRYVGVDVSPTVLDRARVRFVDNPNIKFMHTSEVTALNTAELAISLDVIYHLVEDDVFSRYMNGLFDAATRAVIIYSSNEDKVVQDVHVRHRKFTEWVDQHRSDFEFIEHVPNRHSFNENDPDNTSFADFYVYRKRLVQ